MRRLICSVLAVGAIALATPQLHAQSPRVPIADIAFVRAKPGELNRLLRFYELNWLRARRTVLQQGGISAYRLLVRSDSSTAWDVALYTEYPDSAAYARREEIFQPVLAAQGRTLVDGLAREAFGEILAVHVIRVQAGAP